jgi:hypothetical protein
VTYCYGIGATDYEEDLEHEIAALRTPGGQGKGNGWIWSSEISGVASRPPPRTSTPGYSMGRQ